MHPPPARTLASFFVAAAASAFTSPSPIAVTPWSDRTDLPGPPPSIIVYGPRPAAVPLTEADRVALEIARTDRAISDAEGRVLRSGSDKAKSDYRNARERQSEAREAKGQSFYARATRLTLEARAYVKSSIIQTGPRENDPEVVGRALDQTDDALGRAKQLLEDAAPMAHRRTFDALHNRQEDARRLYKNGAVRSAYAETREVRVGVLELLEKCADLPVSRDTARRALRRAERAMTQTRKEIGPRPAALAVELEREADLQLARARSSFARNGYKDALLHSKLVERHLQRAMEARRVATNQSE
jgi:hypothetical protein